MTNVLDVLAFLQALVRRGAYSQAATYADALPEAVRAVPAIALERARARMRQGRMGDTEQALVEADPRAGSAGERLVIALEAASLRIYRYVAIRAALDDVDAAFAAVNVTTLDPADRAEAERVRSRILLIAGVYYEVDAETARQACDRLPAIAQALEDAGRIDAALAAEFTYAERINDLAERAAALAALAQRAEQLNRPGLAGEAQISRADLLLSNGTASDEIVACLDAATALFLAVDHAHGHIDVQRVKARLAIEREFASTELLETCLSAYNHADYPRGALSVLMDLSQLAHQRGDTAAAATYRRQSLTLAEEVGLGLVRDNFELAQADLLMRNSDYGAAIELCEAGAWTRTWRRRKSTAIVLATRLRILGGAPAEQFVEKPKAGRASQQTILSKSKLFWLERTIFVRAQQWTISLYSYHVALFL